MTRVAGVDPGTFSFDVCVLDGGEVVAERSLRTADVGADPAVLVEALLDDGPFELVLGPAGYGLPLVPASQVGERELALMLLVREDEPHGRVGVGGMRSALARSTSRPSRPTASGTASTWGPRTRSRASRCASPTRRAGSASASPRRPS